jgi:Putative Flp pilus-assembly TadE/G-like
MLVVAVALVAVTGLGVLRLGAAVDERGQAQTAADAAALGGGRAARDGLPALFAALRTADDLETIGDALTCGVGREGALELAAANGAEVTSYCYDSLTDRVEVTVENRATRDAATGTATASAVASLGLLIDDCELGAATLVCGDLEIPRGVDGLRSGSELADLLEEAVRPRLVE